MTGIDCVEVCKNFEMFISMNTLKDEKIRKESKEMMSILSESKYS
jgi:hypothetical protein